VLAQPEADLMLFSASIGLLEDQGTYETLSGFYVDPGINCAA
jgi:hypothetical protein